MALQMGTTNCSLLRVARNVRRMGAGLPATMPRARAASSSASRTSTRRRTATTAAAMISRPSTRVIGRPSRQEFLHHLAVNVSQPEVASRVVVGEALVVEAEQVQEGGVQVVNMNLVLHRREAE